MGFTFSKLSWTAFTCSGVMSRSCLACLHPGRYSGAMPREYLARETLLFLLFHVVCAIAGHYASRTPVTALRPGRPSPPCPLRKAARFAPPRMGFAFAQPHPAR